MLRRVFLASLVPCAASAGLLPSMPWTIERAWLGESDRRHGHDSLGSGSYPGRVHAIVSQRVNGPRVATSLELPEHAAFEDGRVRLADLDADGAAEVVLVAASRAEGAAIVVLGAELRDGAPVLRERARSPATGPGRWLNPVGMADFQGDGRQDVVAVVTPHIGGVLTLYRHQPPRLVPVARERDVSNHVYGQAEQQLAAVTTRNGRRCVAVPNQSRNRLRFLTPTAAGGWESVAPDAVFEHPIERVRALEGNALQVWSGPHQQVLR